MSISQEPSKKMHPKYFNLVLAVTMSLRCRSVDRIIPTASMALNRFRYINMFMVIDMDQI